MKKIKFNRLFLGAVVLAAAATFSLTGTAAHASSLYINSSSKWDTSTQLSVRPNGKVYDNNGKLVGHLTDTDGKAINSIPASGDYQIETRSGKILAATNNSTPGIDTNRSIQINEAGAENSKGGLSSTANSSTTTASNSNSMSSNGSANSADSAMSSPGSSPSANSANSSVNPDYSSSRATTSSAGTSGAPASTNPSGSN